MIKRYDLEWVGLPYVQSQEMVEDKDGDWVLWEDVQALLPPETEDDFSQNKERDR